MSEQPPETNACSADIQTNGTQATAGKVVVVLNVQTLSDPSVEMSCQKVSRQQANEGMGSLGSVPW